jgi:mRNA interferase MazF
VGTPAIGAVVLVRFPFSDLSRSKLRPAIVLAEAGRGDAVLSGSLRVTSFVRPGKIFTANEAIITTTVASLTPDSFTRVLDSVVHLLRPPAPQNAPTETAE